MDIEFIEGVRLSNLCDYSFGDQASVICGLPGGWMIPANQSNFDFINKKNEISLVRNYMTLFIDNIRLYNRNIQTKTDEDQKWIQKLMLENDLLDLCSKFPEMKFIIFTNLEDTAIDESIKNKIPKNVLKIFAVNSIYNDEIVKPFPYGIQRRLNFQDYRSEILKMVMQQDIQPRKLLYISHNILTNITERSNIYEIFENKTWATLSKDRVEYHVFTQIIKSHKFMICPMGNAIDCHRNWEVLYLRRVPIMKKNDYLEKLFEYLPVLFVNDFNEVTEELLNKNLFLYEKMQNFDLSKLDLKNIFQDSVKEALNF
jgi:hypothetical protein